MADNPTPDVIPRHTGRSWLRGALRHEFHPQTRPMNAATNAVNTAAFNIVAYST